MKLLRLFFLLVAFNSILQAGAQQKRALIIAVGTYPTTTRWPRLSSLRDLQYVKEALLQNGFTRNNIDTLVNQYATKKGMVDALDALCNKAQTGDIIYFHFSGHGQQIQDDNDDEADGYDEALVPYDAKGTWDDRDYHGENHFRDDLLEEKLNKLRAKVGANGSVLVVIDACHSGTITRSSGIVRGSDKPCQSASYPKELKMKLGGEQRVEQTMFENMGGSKSSLIAISACSPNQINRELNDSKGLSVGSLSYAFSKAITSLPAGSSYFLLFEKIKATIQNEHPTQIPMIEGDEKLEVMGGGYVPLNETIVVERGIDNADYKKDDTTFYINRGQLYNLNKGTLLSVYKLGEKDVFARAIITDANSFKSICVADRALPKGVPYEVKVEEVNYGGFAASFAVRNDKATGISNTEKQLNRFLGSVPYLSRNSNPDFTVAIENRNNNTVLSLIESEDSIYYKKEIPKNDTLAQRDLTEMLGYIKQSIRIKYLRKIADGGELSKNVKIEIIRLDTLVQSNENVFKPKDEFLLKITNIGFTDFYYTLLDLLPNNQVKVLIPGQLNQPADFYLGIGKSVSDTIIVDADSPNGKEMFKLIVSPEPIDLRLAFNKSQLRKGVARSFERVMDDLFKNENNTRVRGIINMDDVGIVSTGFTIKK